MNKETLTDKYNEIYRALNAEQQIAVDAIQGPVMVIAGPGTGKTQILAARIGNILLKTDTAPENILCLTFTDAGTIAMRKRLLKFIGPDAYKVNIHTFHSFCNEVIQNNLSLFEKNSLDLISDLESIELMTELINEFPKGHALKRHRGDIYYDIGNLKHLFSTMKKEGWTPEYINTKIDEHIQDFLNDDNNYYKKNINNHKIGDLKQDKYDAEVEKMERTRAAVLEFYHVQKKMNEKHRYDFDDMINWVINAFEKNNLLLKNYQEKYLYLLVDEYQDTSGTQNKLVELLIQDEDQNPNIFVVGDDDQSIYRFQGANIENMLNFANKYSSHLKTVILTNNYRSTQPILNVSKTLIENNNERLVNKIDGLDKNLIAANPNINTSTLQPYLQEHLSIRTEYVSITLQVEKLLQSGVKPADIAVLYRENKYGQELATYFRLKNIPYFSKREVDILQQPFIKKVITILQYIDQELDIPYSGDENLFKLLHFDFFDIPAIDIAKITVEVSRKNFNEQSSIRKLIQDKIDESAQTLFDNKINTALKHTAQILEALIHDAPNLTLQNLFEQVIRKAGILSYIMKQPASVLEENNKTWLLQLLTALFDFLKEENTRNPSLTLNAFLHTITLMSEEQLSIPLVQIVGTDKGVNLLTIHGSKGLEFEYVFIVGCTSELWEKKNARSSGFSLPKHIISSVSNESKEEELRRLFFVALTRAIKHLYISFYTFDLKGKESEASKFVAEILDQHTLPIEKIEFSDETLMEFESLHYMEHKPQLENYNDDFIDSILAKFSMNSTALNNYLKCPIHFYYNTIIRIPSGKSENTEFGSAVHFALQRLFEKMQQDEKNNFASVESVINDFEWYMKRHRENFTTEAYKRRKEYGAEILKNYYQKYIHTFNKVVSIERNIANVVLGDIPLKGKLDKLEFNDLHVNVVDYKTGDFNKANDKLKAPTDKNPNGGDYWRQAVFYKILVENYDKKNWIVDSVTFDFVEPDKKNKYEQKKIMISSTDVELVTEQIKDTWTKIQNKDFYTGCGEEKCVWCNFVKDSKLDKAVPLYDDEEQ